jgi:hypothetical protein
MIGYYVFNKLCWQFFGKKIGWLQYHNGQKENVAMVVKWYFIFKTIRRQDGNGHH